MQPKKKIVMHNHTLATLSFLLLSGCAAQREADMVPLNDAARTAGIPQLDMSLYGTGYGPATFTMPGGEVLKGHFHLSLDGAVATGTGSAIGPRGTAVVSGTSFITATHGGFVVQAAGNRGTSITCHGTAGGMGHGDAVCSTSGGAEYQMMF